MGPMLTVVNEHTETGIKPKAPVERSFIGAPLVRETMDDAVPASWRL